MTRAHAELAQEPAIDRRIKVVFSAVAIAVGMCTLAALWVLWPNGTVEVTGSNGQVVGPRPTFRADVRTAQQAPCAPGASQNGPACLRVQIQLDEGPDAGNLTSLSFPLIASSPKLEPGDKIYVAHVSEAVSGPAYYYVDRNRGSVLLLLGAVFVAFVIVLGRWRGAMAILGLAGSIAVLLLFVIPAILAGSDPLVVAVVACSAIAFLALYLAQGFSTVTTVALLGTLGGLVVAIVAAQVWVAMAQFTGFSTEGSFLVSLGAQQVDLSGLVLAGIIIGALGAIDDMTVTQAATVAELRAAAPDMSRRQTFAAAMRVGKDHVASTVNTLVLAYAGASLPLLILFTLTHRSWASVVSEEAVAIEIVRALAGSLGLVAAVPITTALAAAAFASSQREWVFEGIDLMADDEGPLFPDPPS